MSMEFHSQRRRICHSLARSRLSQLILCLLLVLVVTPFVAHYFISNISGEGPQIHKSRSQLDHDEDLDNLKSSDLKGQIEELRRIKASVNNELRDLESKRLGLQSEISSYKTQVEAFRMQQETMEKSIQQSKLNLDQLKLEETELANRFMPLLKAPEHIVLNDNSLKHRPPPSSPQSCQMHNCFDYSRCALLSGFPVYVYDLEYELKSFKLNEYIQLSVYQAFSRNVYVTSRPEEACVFVLVLGETSRPTSSIQEHLHSLSYWGGDGRNHILLNLAQSPANFDLFTGVNTGRAVIVQSSFIETVFRDKFDIIIPPAIGKSEGPVWTVLPPLVPLRRDLFLSFHGQFNEFLDTSSADAGTLNDDKKIQSRKLKQLGTSDDSSKTLVSSLLQLETTIVRRLKKIESDSKEKVYLNFMCSDSVKYGMNGEWCMCGHESEHSAILKQSTFNIIISPANFTVASTTVIQTRLFEALKYGAVPVILGEYTHLPYSELLDWSKAVIILPKARVTELHFLLRTFTDNDIMELKRYGRLFWEKYFGTTVSIIDTTLAVLRTRLQIPAKPVKEEPSENAVSNFIPVAQNLGANPEEETDEVLGPVEPPFPSPMFTHNFSNHMLKGVFNEYGDPFKLFPFTPFEKVLSTDAKFRGSGYGYRPINGGEGGSGKEFSEAIGGNHPREQFTMVMLTYERSEVLIKAVTRLKGLPYLNKVIVVWNNPQAPSENLGWPDIGVPLMVLKMPKNSLNNRFLPFEAIETEAVLSIDDDSHLRHDEIVFGFRVWREERDRIVGFPGRYHAWDVKHNNWLYNSNYSCEMSMVLTGAAFFHKYYAYLYSYEMPQAIRDKVDEYMNCEDIAMNFLVSHITRKPPVKVTSRWTFRCPGCPQQLALDGSHFAERHKCINFFVEVFGYMPLLYTQYRVDSILFKTRISHDKQKCFKFI